MFRRLISVFAESRIFVEICIAESSSFRFGTIKTKCCARITIIRGKACP